MDFNRIREIWDAASIPPKGLVNDTYFVSDQGNRIRHAFAPASEGVDFRGTLVLTHGYGENVDLYYEVIKYYQGMGFDVYGMDWHGQGASERVDINKPRTPGSLGLNRHVDDLRYFIDNIVNPSRCHETPMIMSTNSMGGHIGALYLHDYPDVFDGAIMSAPMFDIQYLGLPSILKPALRMAFNIASAVGLKHMHVADSWETLERIERANTHLDPRELLKDPKNIRQQFVGYLHQACYHKEVGVPTIGWIAATAKTIKVLMKADYLKKITTPMLIGSAGEESFVDNKSHEKAAKYMPNALQVNIPGANHNIWNEDDDILSDWRLHIENFISGVERNFYEKNDPDFPDPIPPMPL